MGDALAVLGSARGASALGEALHVVFEKFGYNNVALVCTRRGVTTDIPWNWMPSAFGEAYFTQNWEACDAEFFYARRTLFPFSWESLPRRIGLTTEQERFISDAASFNLHHGACVPLRGRAGQLDMVTFSSSHRDHSLAPANRNSAALLALYALSRFVELDNKDAASSPASAAHWLTLPRAVPQIDDLIGDRYTLPFTLPVEHLRALVFVHVGAHRWRMGLTKFAAGLYLLRKCRPYSDLERWGFIVDEPDDLRWRYYLAPSVLGLSYLRRTPGGMELCREVWERERGRREVSDGLDAE